MVTVGSTTLVIDLATGTLTAPGSEGALVGRIRQLCAEMQCRRCCREQGAVVEERYQDGKGTIRLVCSMGTVPPSDGR